MKPRTAVLLASLAILLNAGILLPLPVHLRAILAYVLAVPMMGFLLTTAAGVGRESSWLEHTVLAMGSGYAAAVVSVLALSYLPGGMSPWQVLTAFDVMAVVLLASSMREGAVDSRAQNQSIAGARTHSLWLWAGLAAIVITAAVLRIPGLSYSEFQDDEASVLWRSAEVIQGREDALFIHDKGPAEILLTTGIYSATTRTSEAAARFPFAIASISGLLALYWLGSRIFGPVAGWAAAMLLAVDGYFVGFARIVQYQSVVFLMVVLVAGILYKYVEQPNARPVYLYFASIFLATGVLAHYEALFVAIPVVCFAAISLRYRESTLRRARNLILPALLAAAVLASFYAPFSLHPRFERTFSEITQNRIGGQFPYNNLADFFTRTIIYSSTYYVAALLLGLVMILVRTYHLALPRFAASVATVALIAGLLVTSIWPEWLALGRADYTWLFFAVALLPPLLARQIPASERAIWLWFGAVFVLSIFFVQKPRTHVYNFFIPGSLLIGQLTGQIWRALNARLARGRALAVGLPATAVLTLVFGCYVYWLFTYHGAEVLRTWQQNYPVGYWTPYSVPSQNAMFGFPFKNGWKVVGSLYASGALDGPYMRNGKRGVATWYTRGAGDCSRDARYYVFTPQNEPINKGLLAPARRPSAEEGFHLTHVVQVNGETRMEIFERGETPSAPPAYHSVEDYEAQYDAALSSPSFEADGPSASPRIGHPLNYRFGEGIWLRGYTLETNRVQPGQFLYLTLYWQADATPSESYKVFTQIIDMADYQKAGQRDGIPGCERYPTDGWLPGDIIVDRYAISVDPAARQGEYSLLIGLYDANEERLEILTEDGVSLGDALGIDTIFVGP